MRDVVRQHEFLKRKWVCPNNHIKRALNRWKFHPRTPESNRQIGVYTAEGRYQVLSKFPHLDALYEVIDVVDDRMRKSRKRIEELGNDIPEVQRLQSVPGFGKIISLAVYMQIVEIDRFSRAEHLVRYMGLDPVHGSSGDSPAKLGSHFAWPYFAGLLARRAGSESLLGGERSGRTVSG